VTAELAPLELEARPTADITKFDRMMIPNRSMTAPEKAAYRELARDWARLDVIAQRTLYTAFLQRKLTDVVRTMMADIINDNYAELDSFTDPQPRAVYGEFLKHLTNQDAQIMLDLKRTSADMMIDIVGQEFTDVPESRPNPFRRLLGMT